MLLVEVKNQQEKTTPDMVAAFWEKVAFFQTQQPDKTLLAAFLSLAGFTEPALALCRQQRIAWSTELQYF